jgi:hypothetical protein
MTRSPTSVDKSTLWILVTWSFTLEQAGLSSNCGRTSVDIFSDSLWFCTWSWWDCRCWMGGSGFNGGLYEAPWRSTACSFGWCMRLSIWRLACLRARESPPAAAYIFTDFFYCLRCWWWLLKVKQPEMSMLRVAHVCIWTVFRVAKKKRF